MLGAGMPSCRNRRDGGTEPSICPPMIWQAGLSDVPRWSVRRSPASPTVCWSVTLSPASSSRWSPLVAPSGGLSFSTPSYYGPANWLRSSISVRRDLRWNEKTGRLPRNRRPIGPEYQAFRSIVILATPPARTQEVRLLNGRMVREGRGCCNPDPPTDPRIPLFSFPGGFVSS